jgi:glyoxylase-like metal-dependent hydrolase (beta-lactamase superfamily II)
MTPGLPVSLSPNLARRGASFPFVLRTLTHARHADNDSQRRLPFDQLAAIPLMRNWTKPWDNYVEITPVGNAVISFADSRRVLGEIGIAGEILPTPGRTDHCVSLLLDDGSVFTGDLTPEAFAFDNPIALSTWKCLSEHGASRVYPAHGPIRPIDGGAEFTTKTAHKRCVATRYEHESRRDSAT